VHGCPPDDMTTYLFEVSSLRFKSIFKGMKERLCFVGHTHSLNIIQFNGEQVIQSSLKEGKTALKEDMKHIINCGSVGQPRDGDNRAKYVIWDTESRLLEVRFVSYDISLTAAKIIERGLPEIYARRLF
ncbi:MAG: metallophosphoesterase family protein, partial [Deltaproteobacteria bacterium]|nr:metallophosphoesterase family protein [Deltaproteobacteria bacterium]